MATVTVTVPGLLARFTGDRRRVGLEADTVRGTIDALVAAHPAIEPHLLHGDRLRRHLRLFRNGDGIEWEDAARAGLDDGDEVLVLQAVSGG